MKKTFIIAEVGVNHNGDLNLAKKLIIEAKKAGADAVKFQTYNTEKLASIKTPKVKYQKINSKNKESHYEMLKFLELSKDDTKKIYNFCKIKKIEFISTPYDVESAKFLFKLGVKRFKTASADLSDLFLHNYLASTNKEIMISTGMSNIKDIEKCLDFYKSSKNKKIALLHCVSNYPCSHQSLNLNCLDQLKKRFNLKIGFSDHTSKSIAALTAVSKGAEVIEKHFTLNKNYRGPDHKTSLNPTQFKIFVQKIREVEKILGKNIKKLQREEIGMKRVSVKSFIVNKRLLKGHRIIKNDLSLQRPNVGFTGFELRKILGKQLNKNKNRFSHLKKNDFK